MSYRYPKDSVIDVPNKSNTVPDIHVVQVITAPVGGGAEALVRQLGSRLGGHGFTSEVIYFNARGVSGKVVSLRPNETSLGLGSRNPVAVILLRARLKQLRKQHENIVIHAHLTWPFFYTVLAALFLDLNLIYTEHSTTNRRRGLSFLRPLERLFYASYDRLICISSGVREALRDWLGASLEDRIVYVANGAPLYLFRRRAGLSVSDRRPRLISVGSLSVRKGFDTAIRALVELRDQFEEYVIVGEGPERKRLQSLIDGLGLTGKVRLIGWSDDIETLLHDSDLQLIPSVWEGFGLVAVEGMSTGLPVIASDVAGLRDVLGPDNKAITLVADYRRPEAWSVAMEAMIVKLRGDLASIQNDARRRAEKFSVKKMVSGYRAVYRGVVLEGTRTSDRN